MVARKPYLILRFTVKIWVYRGGSRISERGANHSRGSGGLCPPEAIGYFVL